MTKTIYSTHSATASTDTIVKIKNGKDQNKIQLNHQCIQMQKKNTKNITAKKNKPGTNKLPFKVK